MRRSRMEAPRWKAPLELLGTAPDVSGDCDPLDTLLVWKDTCGVSEICVFEMFGVFKSLPFRADGIDILDILASGVPADFRQPSRSAFQPQVRSMWAKTSFSPVEASL